MRLLSKFMTSQTGCQTITIDILPMILWSKGSEIMKLGQLIKHNKKNICLKNCAEIEVVKLVPDLS